MDQELQDFLKDIPDQTNEKDIFGEVVPEVTEEAPEEGETPRINRRERRNGLQQQLDQEREARIRAEARAEAFVEARETSKQTNVDERLLRMYGTTPEGLEAARLQAEILADMSKNARSEALDEMRAEQQRVVQEQKSYESFIDEQLENLEDDHNADLTSDSPAARKLRREVLEEVQRFSPKDADGTITGYANFGAAYETVLLRRQATKPDNSRNKDIAARSMAPSGSVDVPKENANAELQWLRQNGINV